MSALRVRPRPRVALQRAEPRATRDQARQESRGAGLQVQPLDIAPLERTRARLFSSSTSSTFKDSTSPARAAVSYNSRHSAFSRTATSSRRHNRSSCTNGIARVRSAGARRRASDANPRSLNGTRPRVEPIAVTAQGE